MYNINMLVDDELDNMITRSQLSKKFPNKVDIKFGLDANKVKGVDNFPIYNATDGFKSNARSNVDSFMFTSRQTKYDVPGPKHTSVGEIQPYLYNKQGVSRPTESSIRMQPGVMSSLYGLPPDRDIILENPTAQAMNLMGGKMTEEKLRNHIYQKTPGDFFSDPRVTAFMDDSVPIQETSEPGRVQKTSQPEPMQETSEPERVQKRSSQRKEDEIVVEPAFKKTTSDSSDEEEEVVDKKTYDSEISKIKSTLEKLKANPNDKYTTQHKEISDKLNELNFKRPDGKIKVNSKFVEQVEEILAGKRKKKVKPSKEYENTDTGRRSKYEMAAQKRDSSDDEMHFKKTD